MDICRFTGVDDDGYRKARNAIAFHIDRLSKATRKRGSPSGDIAYDTLTSPISGETSNELLKICPSDSNPEYRSKRIASEVQVSLTYPELDARKHQIYEDIWDTYGWVWTLSSFSRWLAEGDGLYWITGRPSSGKSTIIKYILDHPQLQRHLQTSPPRVKWTIVSYFFDFRAGTGMANNLEGLLRSLLLQLVTEFRFYMD
jgi:hypothetical protein